MAQPGEILTEDSIRTLNRDFLAKLSKNPSPDVTRLQTILQDILCTTEEVRLENTHRAAACDALCGLLRHGSSSADAGLRELCTSPQIWKRTMCMYFDRHNDARARPMKQVLETMIRVLQEMPSNDPTKSRACIGYAIQTCTGYLADQTNAGYARPAMFLLDNLLTKKLVHSTDLVALASESSKTISGLQTFSGSERFVYFVLRWARNPDVAPVCGRLLASFCSGLPSTDHDSELGHEKHPANDVWGRPLWQLLEEYPNLIGVLEQDVLPGLLRLNREASIALLYSLPFASLLEDNTAAIGETGIRLCLMMLRINEELESASLDEIFVEGEHSPRASRTPQGLTVAERICANLLRHSNPDVRLTALSLLTSPKHAARPLSLAALDQLQQHIWDFFEETDARIRNDYLSLMKRLFAKLEAIAIRLSKLDTNNASQGGRHASKTLASDQISDHRDLLAANVNFLEVYTERIPGELVPTASYQRHILALKTLTYLQQVKVTATIPEPIDNPQSTRWLLRSLLDLMMDPFEDVRATAASLLLSYSPDLELLLIALENAEKLMRASGRADHADGYGRLVELYYVLEAAAADKKTVDGATDSDTGALLYRHNTFKLIDEINDLIEIASNSLENAVADAPLHGKVIALRYLTASSSAEILVAAADLYELHVSTTTDSNSGSHQVYNRNLLAQRIFHTCQAVWDVVYPVLCDDSPEGTNFLAEDEDDGPDIGIKDTLSYAWRALKESSLLMRSMMGLACKASGIDADIMSKIGQLLFSQLAQLRHRGAFSAVAQSYAAFCSHCIAATATEMTDIVNRLYEDTLACIQEKSTALTRRSAGLPALTVGLLSAKPGGELTARALGDLQQIAQQPIGNGVTSELPQVHALNCLKDIFTSTKLGPVTETSLSSVLLIAVDCLDKELWAIRNSGLMLLKALLLRLEEGRVKSNTVYKKLGRGQYSKTAYAKHPALANVVLNLLRKAKNDTHADTSIHQQERLIEKTFPAMEVIERVGVPPAIAGEVKELLLQHLSSSVWAMRDKTAGCLSLLLNEDEIIHCSRPGNTLQSNAMHGNLLLIRLAVREGRMKSQMSALAAALLGAWDIYMTHTASLIVHELYHETLASVLQIEHVETLIPRYLQLCGHDGNSVLTTEALLDLKYLADDDSRKFADMAITVAAGLARQQEDLIALPLVKQFLPIGTKPNTGSLLTVANSWPKISSATQLIRTTETALHKAKDLSDEALVTLLSFLSTSTVFVRLDDDSREHQRATVCLLNLCRAVLHRRSNALVLNVLIILWGAVSASLVNSLSIDAAVDGEAALATASPQTSSCLAEWYALLRTAMDEQTDVDIREAAIDSIIQFQTVCAALSAPRAILPDALPVLLAVYNGVIDDDEDIRLKSASCASWMLACVNADASICATPTTTRLVTETISDLSSASARQELIRVFKDNYQSSPLLAVEALTRILGAAPDQLPQMPFAKKFWHIEEKSTTLFDEEKQNLFVDEYHEAQTWVQLAACIKDFPDRLNERVVQWIHEGVNFVSSKIDLTDPYDLHGPLGAFSRPDIFLLLARLFLIAGLLLSTKEVQNSSSDPVVSIKANIIRIAHKFGDHERPLTGLTEELHKLLMQALLPEQRAKAIPQSA